MRRSELPVALADLLDELKAWKILRWLRGTYEPVDAASLAELERLRADPPEPEEKDREPAEGLDTAHAVSSARERVFSGDDEGHAILLDLDVPAWLIESSTPGHSHLYIDVDTTWDNVAELLIALVKCGVIEPGYAAASLRRRATFLRLPWVEKGREDVVDLDPSKPESILHFLVGANPESVPVKNEPGDLLLGDVGEMPPW
jgi:hypothetical protein